MCVDDSVGISTVLSPETFCILPSTNETRNDHSCGLHYSRLEASLYIERRFSYPSKWTWSIIEER